jgi:protein transport protein SEC31
MSLISPNIKQMCAAIAWNPDVATQIITSSEDDLDPSLLVWDLRNARLMN